MSPYRSAENNTCEGAELCGKQTKRELTAERQRQASGPVAAPALVAEPATLPWLSQPTCKLFVSLTLAAEPRLVVLSARYDV